MRLIDADALDEKLSALMEKYSSMGRVEVANDYSFVSTVLMTAPTIDAVPVVRCKDCQSFRADEIAARGTGTCWHCEMVRKFDDFCSYGERREGDGDG